MKRLSLILLKVMLTVSTTVGQNYTQMVSGNIEDTDNKLPLISATNINTCKESGIITEPDRNFRLENKLTGNAQSVDGMFYRHSFQFNIAGLGFERYGIAYEWRITSRHALFAQGGGSFPVISEEKEYGFGIHYKYFLQPVKDAKFLWLIKSSYRNTFMDINVRYMNLDGIHEDSQFLFESFYIGAGIGQTYVWKSGFTISYWLGYGPPVGAEFKWKDAVPEDGDSWAKSYKYSSGLDFGLSLGYSF